MTTCPIAEWIEESAEEERDLDRHADKAGLTTSGRNWRRLAARKARYDELLAKAALAEEIYRCGISGSEFRERFAEAESKAVRALGEARKGELSCG